MTKRILSLILLAGMLLSLCACADRRPALPSDPESPIEASVPAESRPEGGEQGGAASPGPEVSGAPVEELPPIQEEEPTGRPEENAPVSVPVALGEEDACQFQSLSSGQKAAYRRLGEAAARLERRVDLADSGLTRSEAMHLLYCYMIDHPQQFWLSHQATVLYRPGDEAALCILLSFTDGSTEDLWVYGGETGYTLERAVDLSKIREQAEAFAAALETLAAGISADGGEVETVRRIHDAVCARVTYDYAAAFTVESSLYPAAFSAYGAAVNGRAVCEGYAKLFQLLCARFGIAATAVIGQAGGDSHMWNAVRIQSNWYYMDLTWDDSVDQSPPGYSYYALTESELSATHVIDRSSLAVPDCQSREAAFGKTFGCELVSQNEPPDGWERVCERIARGQEEYLMLVAAPGQMPGDYVERFFWAADSPFAQKGYSFRFENEYLQMGSILYLRAVR